VQRYSQEPLEAILLPDAPPPARGGAGKTWLMALGAFCLFVVCSGALFWGLGKLANLGFAGAGSRGSLIYSWETPDERRTNLVAAMNAKTTGATAVELRELSRFFTRVMDALAQQDHAAFRAMVDHNAFAHRASLHPAAVAAGDVDQGDMESQLEYDLEGPRDWTRFSIVHVVRGKAANEAIVYGVLLGDAPSTTPARWWLRRSGRNWTICDWEVIDLGTSEAARWGMTRSIDGDANSGQYWQATAAIERAIDEVQAGRRGAAAAQIRDAESKRLPAAVADMTNVEMAIAWLHCERADLTLAALDRITQREEDVGAVYVRARALWDLECQDEFLAEVSRYRALAGCHPELLRKEAEVLEAKGKRSEAADCAWEILRMLPDDREALFDFCRLAEEDRRQEIKQLLAKAKRPVDRALEIAIEAIQRDEFAAAESLVAYIRTAAPNSAALEHLTALQHDYDLEYAPAADHYLSAHKLESHPEKKREHFRRYLASMAAAGRAAEGYEAAEDQAAAFEFLTAGHEYEESYVSDEALAELIALHRQRKPDDPRLLYLSGRLLLNKGDYKAAAAEFLKAEPGAQDELSDLVRSGRLKAIYRQGSIKEAYDAYPNAVMEAFRDLAALAESQADYEALNELIALHRAGNNAGDPWISYYSALRERAAGNHTSALALLTSAQNWADPGFHSMVSRLRTDLYIQADNPEQAYHSGGPPKEAFPFVASRLVDGGHWEGLREVAQLHAVAVPADPNALYYAMKARWHLGEHDKLVQDLTPWPSDRIKTLDQAWAAEIADLFVRSWLRIRPGEEARKVAEQIHSELGLDLPLVTVELALGNHTRAKELLANPIVGREFFQRQLQLDPHAAIILAEPEFAELRRRYGLERPNDYGRKSAAIVLLLESEADEATWQEALDRAVGSEAAADARQLSSSGGEVTRTSRIADLPGGTLIVTARSAPYCQDKDLPDTLATGSPLRKAVEKHAAWIAVDVILANEKGPAEQLEKTAQQLCADLLSDGALAVYASLPRGAPRFVLADEAVRTRLSSGELLAPSSGSEQGAVYLYESGAEQPSTGGQSWSKRRKALRKLADEARVEKASGHAAVRVRFRRGHAEEELWLNVVRSKRSYYRSEEFFGELADDSHLWPHLKSGERVRIGFHEPQEVRPITTSN
jgi:hypothetical protein